MVRGEYYMIDEDNNIIAEAGGFAECLHQGGFPVDRPFPLIAANTQESFAHLKEIVLSEIPVMPYDERI